MSYNFIPQILTLLFIFQPISAASLSSPLHIFLSFRGADTRENLASLMHDALHRAGFNVFMDDESIRTGHDIGLVIRNAINNSMGAVIIFSRNFASSEWCLDELVLILDRKREFGSEYVLQPMYVDGVDPDDIHEERGCYGDAMAKHKERYSYWNWNWHNKVKLWNAALSEVASYKGRILSGKWAKFINEMVEDIRQEFIITLGIKVKPRPQYDPMSKGGVEYPMSMSKGGVEIIYKLVQKFAIMGKFVYKNQWIVDIFLRASFGQNQEGSHVLAQANNPTAGNQKPNNKKKNEMGVLGSKILVLLSCIMLMNRACDLIRRKIREILRYYPSDNVVAGSTTGNTDAAEEIIDPEIWAAKLEEIMKLKLS